MSTKVDFSYKALFRQAAIDAFKKLHPREEIKNLVMFVVWLGSIWTTIILFLPGQFNLFNVRTVMITSDNQLTAAAIAAEAGVDDYIAQAKPEDKLARIRKEQERGKLIAMIGDGTNDAPALAKADVGVACSTWRWMRWMPPRSPARLRKIISAALAVFTLF